MELKMRMKIKPTIGAENEAKITTVLKTKNESENDMKLRLGIRKRFR